MKKRFVFIISLSLITCNEILAKNSADPIKDIPISNFDWSIDNPKGKFRIRFIKIEDKSDTTAKPKGIFGKLKSVINMVMNASDNPPFKVEIVREKTKNK